MYILRARFSKKDENPRGRLMSFGHKMKVTKNDREIEFETLPSKKKLKEIIIEHYQKYNGEIKFVGKIEYYQFFKCYGETLYIFDSCGNIIENKKLIKLLLKWQCRSKEYLEKDLEYIYRFGEVYIEYFEAIKKAIEQYDPFEIALVDCKEHEPEIRDILYKSIGKNLTKKKLFFIVKDVFDKWFEKRKENYPKYEAIANDIYEFYEEKLKIDEWFKEDE